MMKTAQKIFSILLFTLISCTSYGQSNTKEYLTKDWISTTKIFDTGDTIQSSNEELILKKDGSMAMLEKGMNLPGKWKYVEESNQLELTLNIGGRSETVTLDIDKSTDTDLILTQRKANRFKTVVYKVKISEK